MQLGLVLCGSFYLGEAQLAHAPGEARERGGEGGPGGLANRERRDSMRQETGSEHDEEKETGFFRPPHVNIVGFASAHVDTHQIE